MFGNSKKSEVPPPSQAPSATGTVIGKGTTFQGSIETEGDIFVQGNLSGSVVSKGNVVVNDGSKVDADIECNTLVVHGDINGNVLVYQRLDIGSSGKIKGDVKAGSARVAEGGLLDGVCSIVPEGISEAQRAAPVKATPAKPKDSEKEKPDG